MIDDDDYEVEITAKDIETEIVERMAQCDFVNTVETFEERGVLTGDRGVVIRMGDGSEFHVTIVQSRKAR